MPVTNCPKCKTEHRGQPLGWWCPSKKPYRGKSK